MPSYFGSVLMHLLRISSLSYKPSFFTEIVYQGNDNPEYFGYLKTTFTLDPRKGFHDQPRLRSEAEKKGWKLIGNGCKNGKFPLPGLHYTDEFDTLENRGGEINLIYDVNGYIAGVSAVTEIKSPTIPNPGYFQNPLFQKVPGRKGVMNYQTTVYFIHPSKVCAGRSHAEFKKQGTGTGVYAVNGPSVNNLIHPPLYLPDPESQGFFQGACFMNMGQHVMHFNFKNPNVVGPNCTNATPLILLYEPNPPHDLIGFMLFSYSLPDGNRWELIPFPSLAITLGDNYAPCYVELTKGSKTMHFFLKDYHRTCKI